MNFFLLQPPIENPEDVAVIPVPQTVSNNGTDNRIPDEVIHLKSLSRMYTEDCVAVGCREDLW